MEFIESGLKFTFDDNSWSDLVQYDKEIDCKKIQHAIDGTKAVDFIGILKKQSLILVLFEVKSFRGHRIENKDRLSSGELVEEFAQKVRDTTAGIIGAARNSTHLQTLWKAHSKKLLENEVHVVCWVEEDRTITASTVQRKRNKSKAGGLNQLLKSKLSWLTTKVMIADIMNNPYPNALQTSFMTTNSDKK